MHNNRFVICWRFAEFTDINSKDYSADSNQQSTLNGIDALKARLDDVTLTMADAALLATVCCMVCVNFLQQSEIWALEDISREFSGLKLSARCSIGLGSILDAHIGVPGIKMDTLLKGTAYSSAFNGMTEKLAFGEIAFNENGYSAIPEMKELGIKLEDINGKVFKILPQDTDLDELKEIVKQLSDDILFHNIEHDSIIVGSAIESYIPETVLHYIQSCRRKRKFNLTSNGAWTKTAVLAIQVQPQCSEQSTAEKNAAKTPSKSEIQEYLNDVQEIITRVIKKCKTYNLHLNRVFANPDDSVNFICNISTLWSDSRTVILIH